MRKSFSTEESIRNRKLIASNADFMERIAHLFQSLFLLSMTVLGTVPIFTILYDGTINFLMIIWTPFFVLGILSAYSVFRANKLIVIQGQDQKTNMELIHEEFTELFKTKKVHQGYELVTYFTRSTMWRFGIRVIAICKDDLIYVNITRFNYYELRSPIHQLFDDIRILILKRRIQKNKNSLQQWRA